jgi:hypothetical protein
MLDDFLPQYEFRSRHETTVPAPPEIVWRAVEEWRPEESLPWRWLLRLRGLGGPHGSLREWAESLGFLRLAETETEVVYGQAGRFWSPWERSALVSPRTVEEFRAVDDPRCAVAAMTIRGEPLPGGGTRLCTETRIHALSDGARRRFRLYWLLIGPFSGLLRRSMLNGMRARAIALAANTPHNLERSRRDAA